MCVGAAWNNLQCSQQQARIQELFTPNCSTVYVLVSKAYSHEGKQTVVSIICPVSADFTYHDPAPWDSAPQYWTLFTQKLIKFWLDSNRVSCYSFCLSSYPLLIKKKADSYDDWRVIGTRFDGLVFRTFLSENCYTLFLTLVL